jgi:hypothetical protein
MTELSIAEETALVEHLTLAPDALETHIRAGGTFAEYVQRWKRDRDEAARRKKPDPATLAAVLAAPADKYDDCPTVRHYLVELLAKFWAGEANQKYGMGGDSDWQYDVYEPLCRAGLIPGWRQGYGIGYRADGTVDRGDQKRADKLIVAAIRTLAADSRIVLATEEVDPLG